MCLHVIHVLTIAAIIRYIESLQSPFFLSVVPPYTGQCTHWECTVQVCCLYNALVL
jgi:hypothetical protein